MIQPAARSFWTASISASTTWKIGGVKLASFSRSENGAGKTTVTKLIARLYDPTGGEILLDGIDLREYDLEDWRREIGVIFQIGKWRGKNNRDEAHRAPL